MPELNLLEQSKHYSENEIIPHAALFIVVIILASYSCHALSNNIITHIIYTMTSCLPLHSALELEATQGHPIDYYRPSACWFALR